jgi:hypothetical protein
MAEVGLKEFTIVEVGIVGNSLSLSPLALVVTPVRALSLIISGTAKDGSDVLGNVSWGAEVSLWNQGKTVANNTYFDYGKLFESNFCHPPTTEDWQVDAPVCLNRTDDQSCAAEGCVWSTGKSLINAQGGFCQLEYVSQNATDYMWCSQF